VSVFPQGFTRRLQRAGVGRVQFAYHWHSDERHLDLVILGPDGQPSDTLLELEGAIQAAIYEACPVVGYGTYLWDLASGEVVPFGQLTYLTGDVLGGTYQVTFTGDPEETLAARGTPDPTRAQVDAWVASPDPKLRVAVAGNRSVPDDWVTQLHGDLDPLVVQVMAARPGRAPLLSTHLTDAGNPMTLPRVLDTLARSEWAQVRRTVAANPSTPGRTLADLARDPEWRVRLAVLDNPSVGDDVRPALLTFFSGADVTLRCLAAREESISPDLLSMYAADPDPTVRAAVMGRSDLPGDLFQLLASDPHGLVQEALAYGPDHELEVPFDESWPPEEQWRIALMPRGGDSWIRNDLDALAHAPNLLPELRALFLTQPRMYFSLMWRPDLTDDDLLVMAQGGASSEWLRLLPGRPLPADFFRKLLPRLNEYERGVLVMRPDLPADVLEELLSHCSPTTWADMAEKGVLNEPLARRLAADPAEWLAGRLLANPTLPPAVAREVLDRLGPGVLNPYIHTTERLPPELLGVYAEVATGDVLVNLAANPGTPPLPIIEQLRSLGPDAALNLLGDPTTPPEMLARLVGTGHDLLLVRHPNFTADHLRAVITQGVRRHNRYGSEHVAALLDSPFMTPDLWDTLVSVPHLDWQQRAMVAARPDLPAFIARRLKDDPVQTVARAVRRDLWPDL